MKSIQEKIFDYLKENPKADYDQITSDLDLKSRPNVHIHRLKKKGILEGGPGDFKVTGEYDLKKDENNKENVLLEMIEYYLEDFREATDFDERLRIGREIRLLLDQVR